MNLLAVVLQAQGGADYSFLIMMVAILPLCTFYDSSPEQEAERNCQVPQEFGSRTVCSNCGWNLWKIKEVEDNTVVVEVAAGVKSR